MNPSQNTSSKITLMLLSVCMSAYCLSSFALLVQSLLAIPYQWQLEAIIVLGQLVFQLPFIFRRKATDIFEYYYNMLLISLIGSMLLLPIIVYNMYLPLPQEWNIFYFFGVVSILFIEHVRRVKMLKLPRYLCITWLIYRFIILFFIL